MDLTQRLLTLGPPERALLVDLYQARFVDGPLLAELAELCGADPEALRSRGLLRTAVGPDGETHYLSGSGQRAALSLLPQAQSGGRAYAALRLEHELARARLYGALRRRGMQPPDYRAEPRLTFRSAAGLGTRTLVPDALLESDAMWLIEVDRATERDAALRGKWLRYREWQIDAGGPRRVAVLLAGGASAVERSLAGSGLAATLYRTAEELAAAAWPGDGLAAAGRADFKGGP